MLTSAPAIPSRYPVQVQILVLCLLNLDIGVQRRFIKAMEGYFSGVVRQEDLRSLVERQDIEEYIAVRRESVGVMPCLALIESVTPKGTTISVSE